MLKERNQRGSNRNDLSRRNVHVLDLVRLLQFKLTLEAAGHEFVGQLEFLVKFGVCLGNDVLALFNRRQILDRIGNMAVFHLTIRSFHETIFVGTSIKRQRIDQADVRTFRSFDRANAAVMRRMYVTHFESGTLTSQTTRA